MPGNKHDRGHWIHLRADHIMDKNPGMKKNIAYGVATEQAYAAGKAPKGWGTAQGHHQANKKYDEPKSHYKKVADPNTKSKTSSLALEMMLGFADELEKIALPKAPSVGDVRKSVLSAGTALSTKKPAYTKVHKEPSPPASNHDLLESSKVVQPPPVTMPTAL